MAVGAIISYLAIIFVHELGHAWVASRLGYEVFAIRIGLIHGRCEFEAPYSLWDAALVSWGGVLAQLLVAAVVLLISSVLPDDSGNYFGPKGVHDFDWAYSSRFITTFRSHRRNMKRRRSILKTVAVSAVLAAALIPALAIEIWEVLHGRGHAQPR